MQASKEVNGINTFFNDLYGQNPAERTGRKRTIYSSSVANGARVTLDAQRVCHLEIPEKTILPANTKAAVTKLAKFIKETPGFDILSIELKTGDRAGVFSKMPEGWKNGDPSLHTDVQGNELRVWKSLKSEQAEKSPLAKPSRFAFLAGLFGIK